MYIPSYNAQEQPEVLHQVIQENPLGILMVNGKGGLDAHHLPFELNIQEKLLQAHVARQNSVWQDVSSGDEVLVVFRGPDSYISPNWYPSKSERHDHVPTWNYVVVHAHGRIRIRDEQRFVQGVVGRLTRIHEAQQSQPWKMRDLTPQARDQMLSEIVGIEVEIDRLVGKFKLSQNRSQRDLQGACEGLRGLGHHAMAEAMQTSYSEVERLRLKTATYADLAALETLGKRTFRETFEESNNEGDLERYLSESFHPEKLRSQLNEPNSHFVLAWDGDEPVGYLKVNTDSAQTELSDDATSLEIERIYVLQAYHGQKVGALLLKRAFELAREKKKSYLWLGVWEKNPRAIRFYEKNGFVAFGEHVFALGEDRQVDVMMRCEA